MCYGRYFHNIRTVILDTAKEHTSAVVGKCHEKDGVKIHIAAEKRRTTTKDIYVVTAK